MVGIIRKCGLILLLHLSGLGGFAQGHLFSEVSVNRSTVYVGQPVEVTVSVFTSTWFTSGVQPGNIKVNDAFTVYFRSLSSTERIDGKTYAGVRMIYNVFPYDDKDIIFPSLDIQVETPDEGSSKGVRRTVKTQEKIIKVKPAPANYDRGTWMVSSSVSVSENWSGDLRNVKVGDVLERNVVRIIQGSVAELIPPIRWDTIAGVSIYPSRGEVKNNKSKTAISASRTDGVKYLFEEEGEIVIPEMVVLWWNPVSSKMQKRTLKESLIQVQPNPDLGMLKSIRDSLTVSNASLEGEANEVGKRSILGLSPKEFGLAVVLLILLLYILYRIYIPLRKAVIQRRKNYLSSEKYYFKKFQKAARGTDNSLVIQFLYRWIDQLQLPEPTLTYFVKMYGNKGLIEDIVESGKDSTSSAISDSKVKEWSDARRNYILGKSNFESKQKPWINP